MSTNNRFFFCKKVEIGVGNLVSKQKHGNVKQIHFSVNETSQTQSREKKRKVKKKRLNADKSALAHGNLEND